MQYNLCDRINKNFAAKVLSKIYYPSHSVRHNKTRPEKMQTHTFFRETIKDIELGKYDVLTCSLTLKLL